MLAIVLIGVLTDRTALTLRLVCWAAAVILVIQPESLTGASFQLLRRGRGVDRRLGNGAAVARVAMPKASTAPTACAGVSAATPPIRC